MTYIPEALRQLVIERASAHCEYCLIHRDVYFYPHEVDHIIPEKHRGTSTADNLCLSCLECNRHKGTDFASFDPETGGIIRLFNPRTDDWAEHFRHEDGYIQLLTAIGRVTVFVLAFNAEPRRLERVALIRRGKYPVS